mmetsp:Transcript_53982/g.135681  ORF Transcript_53982/g.135681 Transcript_53982/m.135681 type:complete len:192 (-) Transcript_53982:149-724(-)
MKFRVYEGERLMAKDNHFLGSFVLSGIPPLPKGVAKVWTYMEIDHNGILHVTAVDKATGSTANVTITNSGQLAEAQVERMIRDAQLFEAEDREHKERATAIGAMTGYLDALRRTSEDLKRQGKLTGDQYEILREAIREGEEWLAENREASVDAIREQQREVEEKVKPIIMAFYSSGSSPDDEFYSDDHDEL